MAKKGNVIAAIIAIAVLSAGLNPVLFRYNAGNSNIVGRAQFC